jgi:lipoic acid synthetase
MTEKTEPKTEPTLHISQPEALHIAKPHWLKTKIPTGSTFFQIQKDFKERNLYTVCQEAKCPNITECWSTNTATFMVLGGVCTRACRFCNVATGNPQGVVNIEEPMQVAESSKLMNLRYVVITMVDRDDMSDGGAAHVTNVVRKVKEINPGIKVELLAGDFKGEVDALKSILTAQPEVYAHNIETVERLTPRVRDRRATYRLSLQVLKQVKEIADYRLYTKSALMLGLGEQKDEVIQALKDLRQANVDFVTIGQYMRPTKKHLSIKRWVTPEEFDEFKVIAQDLGFSGVASAPLVRSSYKAREFFEFATMAR